MKVSRKEVTERLARAIADLRMEEANKSLNDAIETGVPVSDIIQNGLVRGMEIVGERYERKEYFLSELVLSAMIVKSSIRTLKPHLPKEGREISGKVVVGTIKGQIHDIGKDLVATLLETSGFEVYDLGSDVPPEKFVEKAKEVNADIIAISALLTMTLTNIEKVIQMLEKEGLRDKISVMVGGRAVTKEFADKIGVAYGETAFDAAKIAKMLTKKKWQ